MSDKNFKPIFNLSGAGGKGSKPEGTSQSADAAVATGAAGAVPVADPSPVASPVADAAGAVADATGADAAVATVATGAAGVDAVAAGADAGAKAPKSVRPLEYSFFRLSELDFTKLKKENFDDLIHCIQDLSDYKEKVYTYEEWPGEIAGVEDFKYWLFRKFLVDSLLLISSYMAIKDLKTTMKPIELKKEINIGMNINDVSVLQHYTHFTDEGNNITGIELGKQLFDNEFIIYNDQPNHDVPDITLNFTACGSNTRTSDYDISIPFPNLGKTIMDLLNKIDRLPSKSVSVGGSLPPEGGNAEPDAGGKAEPEAGKAEPPAGGNAEPDAGGKAEP